MCLALMGRDAEEDASHPCKVRKKWVQIVSHFHLAEVKTRDCVDHLVRMVAEMLGNGVSGLW